MYVIRTGSMTPTIPPRSVIIVRKGVYHLGQVITFYSPNGIVSHRFVKRDSDGTIVTKGDANETADPSSTPPDKIIGGVVAAPKSIGYWLVYFQNPYGIASLVMAIVCLWLLYSITEDLGKPVETNSLKQQMAG